MLIISTQTIIGECSHGQESRAGKSEGYAIEKSRTKSAG
jgi:hypothetical protein